MNYDVFQKINLVKIQQIQNELQLPTSMNMSKKTMEYKNKEKALRNMKLQITQQIKEWSEDYKKINCLFNLSKINQNSHRITTNPKDNFQVSQNNSQSLILLLAFVIILFFTELFLMIHKNNFWNITVSLLSISIFTFKYFDKIYIRLLIGLFFISIGFDIAWTLFKFENYWNLSRQGLEISKIGAFYKFIWVINILLIIIKIVILAILLKYKDNQEHHKMIIGHIIIILNPQKDQNQISTIIDRMFKKY